MSVCPNPLPKAQVLLPALVLRKVRLTHEVCCERVKQEVLMASVQEPAGKSRISPVPWSRASQSVVTPPASSGDTLKEFTGWKHF